MPLGLISSSILTNIASAIRSKLGSQADIKPSQMAAAIRMIPSGGGGSAVPLPEMDLMELSSYPTKLANGRIIGPFPQNSYVGVRPVFSDSLDFSSDKWALGAAFMLTSITQSGVIWGNSGGPGYAVTPNFEALSSGSIGVGIGKANSTWGNWITASSLSANQWYFIEVSYDPATNTETIISTTDFVNFTTNTYQISFQIVSGDNSSYMRLGRFPSGYSGHMSSYLHIDLLNTYIKKDDAIIWGNYTGSFPQ